MGMFIIARPLRPFIASVDPTLFETGQDSNEVTLSADADISVIQVEPDCLVHKALVTFVGFSVHRLNRRVTKSDLLRESTSNDAEA